MFRYRASVDVSKRSGGFTLVELLVVITIIGILVGMLLPAVNSARESGRNLQCKNNLAQIGKACLAHEEAQGFFPTGGWGQSWVGDPDRGYNDQQPGGWIYNILPHTEMNNMHDQQFLLPSGTTVVGRTAPGATPNNGIKQQAIQQMVTAPLAIANCPSRRRTALFPPGPSTTLSNASGVSLAGPVAKTDYAISCGTAQEVEIGAGPATGADAVSSGPAAQATYFKTRRASNVQTFAGISFEQSTIRKDDITSGLSSTLLAGEKYLAPDFYSTGGTVGDNRSMYVGMASDIGRATFQPPMQDRSGISNVVKDALGNSSVLAFGSAHPNGANFVLCDGSTVSINYSVDPPTFLSFGQRSNRASPLDMTLLLGKGG